MTRYEGDLVPDLLLVWIATLSLLAFGLMALDKRRARRYGRRVPERTLLGIALLGGAPGAWLAMQTVRHKTRHTRFRVLLPLFTALWLALAILTRRP